MILKNGILCLYILPTLIALAYSQGGFEIEAVYNVSFSNFPQNSQVQVVGDNVYYVTLTHNEIAKMQIDNPLIVNTSSLNSNSVVVFTILNTTFGIAVYSTRSLPISLAFFNPTNFALISDPVALDIPKDYYPASLVHTLGTPDGIVYSLMVQDTGKVNFTKISYENGSILATATICPSGYVVRDTIPIEDWRNSSWPGLLVFSCIKMENNSNPQNIFDLEIIVFDLEFWCLYSQLHVENATGPVTAVVTILIGYAVRISPTEIEYFCYSLYDNEVITSVTFKPLADSDSFVFWSGGNASVIAVQVAPDLINPVASEVTIMQYINLDVNISVAGNIVSKQYIFSYAGFTHDFNYYLWATQKGNNNSLIPSLVKIGYPFSLYY